MQRLVGVSALAACACLVAGCGGNALRAKARKVVGDPHATVVDVEEPQLLNRERVTILVLKPSGRTGLGCAVALGYSGSSLTPGCPRSTWDAVGLNPKTHAYVGDWVTSRAEVAAIHRARLASPRFMTSFSGIDGPTVRCNLTRTGAPGGTVAGMCATSAAEPEGRPWCVVFSEGWRPTPGSKLRTRAWVVRLSRHERVLSTGLAKRAPQPWAGAPLRACPAD